MRIKCTPDSPKSMLKDCYQICKQLGQVWSPFEMQCIDCKECQCSSPVQSYNFYRRKCEIDCSLVKHAAYASGYAFNTKCVCVPPYVWDEQLSLCRLDCQLVDNADPEADQLSLQFDQCQCSLGYRYSNYSNDPEMPGMCLLACQNDSSPLFDGKQQFCLCSADEKWDRASLSCLKVLKNEIVFPVWSIVLISLFSVAIAVLFGLFVRMIISIAKKGGSLVPVNEEGKKLEDAACSSGKQRTCQICQSKETQTEC